MIKMISVREAKKLLIENAAVTPDEQLPLYKALRRVLAEDVVSPFDHPHFNQSTVDGYAFKYDDKLSLQQKLNVIGVLKAGDTQDIYVNPGEAVRIFTGAALPSGCDTVIMQEDVKVTGSTITIAEFPEKNANIRFKGSQIKKSGITLQRGTILNETSLGFLASLGIGSVKVHQLPSIGMIVTGSEFTDNPKEIKRGKIFESNSLVLTGALSSIGISTSHTLCGDDREKLSRMVSQTSKSYDLLIITGGVSVGDCDFTKPVLESLGFNVIFHKVSQKPGKPLLFARNNNKFVFGLPGNPGAVIVCFYEYIYPFIRRCLGCSEPFLKEIRLPLIHDYEKTIKRELFLAARFEKSGIRIPDKQDPGMLGSFALADCLAVMESGIKSYKAGDLITIHLLPRV